jgi:hypothetical protein
MSGVAEVLCVTRTNWVWGRPMQRSPNWHLTDATDKRNMQHKLHHDLQVIRAREGNLSIHERKESNCRSALLQTSLVKIIASSPHSANKETLTSKQTTPIFCSNHITNNEFVHSQEDSWYSFLLQSESTPGSQCGWKNEVNRKTQWPHRAQNLRPSGT